MGKNTRKKKFTEFKNKPNRTKEIINFRRKKKNKIESRKRKGNFEEAFQLILSSSSIERML